MKKFIILSLTILLASCNNINEENPIPYYPVNFSINILQEAPMLDIQGGYFEMTKPLKYGQYVGFGGVVVFHTFDNYFVAFDMACPNEANQNVKVKTDMAGRAVCDSCHSVFDVGFGSGYPTSGPSKYPLKRYNVYPSGYNIHVAN